MNVKVLSSCVSTCLPVPGSPLCDMPILAKVFALKATKLCEKYVVEVGSMVRQGHLSYEPVRGNPTRSEAIQSNPLKPIQSKPVQSSQSKPVHNNPAQPNPVEPLYPIQTTSITPFYKLEPFSPYMDCETYRCFCFCFCFRFRFYSRLLLLAPPLLLGRRARGRGAIFFPERLFLAARGRGGGGHGAGEFACAEAVTGLEGAEDGFREVLAVGELVGEREDKRREKEGGGKRGGGESHIRNSILGKSMS